MGIRLAIKEPDFLTIREEDEGNTQLLGIVPTLILGRDNINAGVLGFQSRCWPALPITEYVVRFRAVGQLFLKQNARSVGQVSARILEQTVNLDPCEGFLPVVRAGVLQLISPNSWPCPGMAR